MHRKDFLHMIYCLIHVSGFPDDMLRYPLYCAQHERMLARVLLSLARDTMLVRDLYLRYVGYHRAMPGSKFGSQRRSPLCSLLYAR